MKDFTTAQVAQYFEVSPRSVQRWIRNGHVPTAQRRGPAINSPYVVPEGDVHSLEGKLRRPKGRTPTGPSRRQPGTGPSRTSIRR
jgi:predicted site-specific integrase-resolvase